MYTIDDDTLIALENSVITLQRVLKAIKTPAGEQPAPVVEQPVAQPEVQTPPPVAEQPAPATVQFTDDQVRTWMISSGVEISREWIDWISGATGAAAREALTSAYPGLWEECELRMTEQQAMNSAYVAPQQIATEPAPVTAQPVAQPVAQPEIQPAAQPEIQPAAQTPPPVAEQPAAQTPPPVAEQPAAQTPPPVAEQPAAQPAASGEMDDMAELENELAAIENEGALA